MNGFLNEEKIPFGTINKDEVEFIETNCSYCQLPHSLCVVPWAPPVAKFYCRRCEQTSEVRTRESNYTWLREYVAEGKEWKYTKAKCRTWYTKSSPSGRLVTTKFGPAYLVGKDNAN